MHLKGSISSKKHKYHYESDLFKYSLKLKREKQTLLEIRSESRSTLGRKGSQREVVPTFLFIERNLIQRNVNKRISRNDINIIPMVPEEILLAAGKDSRS